MSYPPGFVPFKNRGPMWSDVIPIPQFSNSVKVMQMETDPKYNEIMSTFRYILAKNEISLRAYNLTTEVLNENATNYMAWVVRRQCLDKFSEIDLEKELTWLNEMICDNQKNYQIWHHRKLILDRLNTCAGEKEIMEKIFVTEPKNFHAWQHRIWVIKRFCNVEGELSFIEKMMKQDVMNNSVWNHRYFVVNFINKQVITPTVLAQEVEYAMGKMSVNINNECPYNYVRGILKKCGKKLKDFPQLEEQCNQLLAADKEPNKNPSQKYVYNMLLDINEERGDLDKALELLDILNELDPMRRKYYINRRETIKQKMKENEKFKEEEKK